MDADPFFWSIISRKFLSLDFFFYPGSMAPTGATVMGD
jgi:hypothetical protein